MSKNQKAAKNKTDESGSAIAIRHAAEPARKGKGRRAIDLVRLQKAAQKTDESESASAIAFRHAAELAQKGQGRRAIDLVRLTADLLESTLDEAAERKRDEFVAVMCEIHDNDPAAYQRMIAYARSMAAQNPSKAVRK